MLFLLLLSSIIGSIENTFASALTLFSAWMIFVNVCPEILNTAFSKLAESNTKSFFKHENQKSEILKKYEEESLNKIKNLETMAEKLEANKILIQQYLNNEFKELQ